MRRIGSAPRGAEEREGGGRAAPGGRGSGERSPFGQQLGQGHPAAAAGRNAADLAKRQRANCAHECIS